MLPFSIIKIHVQKCKIRENPNTLDMVDQNIPFFRLFYFYRTNHAPFNFARNVSTKGLRSTSNRKKFTRQCDVTELNTTPKIDVETVTNFLFKILMPFVRHALQQREGNCDSYKFSLHGFKKLSLLFHLASSVVNARKLGLL